ncbi:MAG: tetratricopeptide repeat protein [Planctomycetota bacterium]|nr:tetratricopeptide repeat protein [Planctomycetota bacterium]
MNRKRARVAGTILLAMTSIPAQAQIVPKSDAPSNAVVKAMEAPFLTVEERRAMRVAHGLWEQGDLGSVNDRALASTLMWNFDERIDPGALPQLQARAHVQRGEANEAIAVLADRSDVESCQLRAQALLSLGQHAAAADAARACIDSMKSNASPSRETIASVAEALLVLERVEPLDAKVFQSVLDALGSAREADRLDWRAPLAEGRILLAHHNNNDGIAALHEAVALNPRLAEAWYLLGITAARQFDFDGAATAVAQLDEITPAGPLGALLRAQLALVRTDPDGAADAAREVLMMAPHQREALALMAAAQSLRYSEDALHQALADFDSAAGQNALATYDAGRFLSLHRQYALAERMLTEAHRREPHWSAPELELGLLRMQTGNDEAALVALRGATSRDPFDVRAKLSLSLLEEIASWPVLEGKHFRIRCQRGPDQGLAAEMIAPLDAMHDEVCSALGYDVKGKTLIELMPDHEYFGVRLTGTPFIHTIAASTGPVIAMEPPREGAARKHLGLFDWLDVIRHEYTHTVTLEQTGNRIPHWMTEAIAVDMEHGTRDDNTYNMLAHAWHNDGLFDLEEIKWAFVRPKQPTDRALAYAQGHWMVQFIRSRWGVEAVPSMLRLYATGLNEREVMAQVLNRTPEEFLTEFNAFAGVQVREWGYDAKPSLEELLGEQGAVAGGATLTSERLDELIALHPDHPDLAELVARRTISAASGEIDAEAVAALTRYSALRPVDLWPRRKLVAYLVANHRAAEAEPHLVALDRAADNQPVYAVELARLARARRDPKTAVDWWSRATRIDPFDATIREEAAATAIEAQDLATARVHILALTQIEPDRPAHAKRLARINELMAK